MGTIAYNTVETNLTAIYRATSGGTVFSGNIVGASFDYFTDTPAVDDAIYFGMTSIVSVLSDFKFNVGTPMAGTDIVLKWEYFNRSMAGTVGAWVEIPNLTDNTNGFTTTGINIVKFPPPAYLWFNQPTNLAGIFIRCRLVSFTTVTEGGANATTIPTKKNGAYTCTGFSSTDLLTAQILYDWTVANAPEIPVFRRGFYYEFPVGGSLPFFYSRKEIILFGNNHAYAGVGLPDAIIGEEFGDSGYNGSLIAYSGFSGGTAFNPSTGKFYNTKICGIPYYDQYNDTVLPMNNNYLTLRAGYGSTQTYGCLVEEGGYLSSSTIYKNTINSGNLITNSAIPDSTGMTGAVFVAKNTPVFNLYNNNTYIFRGVKVDTNNYFCVPNYTTYGNMTLKLIDSTKAPGASNVLPGAVRVQKSDPANITSNMTAVHFFDSSAGTFTSYTTQANNATANDVPLSGDVGDMYYFGIGTSAIGIRVFSPVLRFTHAIQANDYVYEWEFNHNSLGWIPFTNVWDRTNNMTNTGDETIIFQYTTNTADTIPVSTINGVNAAYIRCKIVTKGTATPTATRIRMNVRYANNPNWKFEEYYSLDIKVVDAISKLPIEDADVVVVDKDNTGVATVATDSSGDIATQTVQIDYYDYDPYSTDTSFFKQTWQTPHTITISKTGYQTKVIPIEILEKTSLTISLEKAVDAVIAKGKLVINTDPSNSQSDVFI